MALQSGVRLGPYEIQAALGAGGMGEVYRARDTTLNRDVAIKVIPDLFATDPDRLARFEREAQMLAALNHPNIAQVYGLERQEARDGQNQRPVSFIAMELVDGDELARRIAGAPMPLDEALPIAAQIAAALEAAHEQGIVHRDLKPANIKIKPDGTVKVLDFGLAKAMDASAAANTNASISPTLSVHATQAGVILGTAAYMSPEQARGRPVDKRGDIWAFGVVLYEMVTGRKPFHGDDVGEVLAGVIKEQPKWDDVPPSLRRLLQRCLEKDPKKRLRDISGVGLLLEEPPAAAPVRSGAQRLPWIAAAVLSVIAAVALWAPWNRTRIETRPLVRLDVDLGADIALGSPQGTDVIISPDGTRLAWVSRGRLFTRRLDQPKTIELPGTVGAFSPFFSPDGRWVAFFTTQKLRKVSVDGGAAVILCDAVRGFGGSWGEDGRIIASLDGVTLATVSDAGGTPSPLIELTKNENGHRWPHILPGGRAVLFTARQAAGGSFDDATIDVFSLSDRRRKTLHRGAALARYVTAPNGTSYLVYVSRGTLFATRFDVDRLEVTGTAVPVVDEISYSGLNGTAQVDVSRTGVVVYRQGGASALASLNWLDAKGNIEALPAAPSEFLQPRLSPDGKLLAVAKRGPSGQDIWVYDWQRDALSPVTIGGIAFSFPVWTPDGRFLVFQGTGGMFWTRGDGGTKVQALTENKAAQFPWSFSPDGRRLAYAEFLAGTGDIWTVAIETTSSGLKAGKPEPFLQTAANELYPAFSPDGRWIAYRTFESGISEIQVRAFPDTGGKWLISSNGGAVPVWSPNGRELFYRTDDQRIMVVPYTVRGDVFVAEKPRLWSDKRLVETGQRNLDLAPDGSRFLVLAPVNAESQKAVSHIVFLENFADELARRLGAAK